MLKVLGKKCTDSYCKENHLRITLRICERINAETQISNLLEKLYAAKSASDMNDMSAIVMLNMSLHRGYYSLDVVKVVHRWMYMMYRLPSDGSRKTDC